MSKSKYNNDFKSEVIKNGHVSAVLKKKKELYYDSKYQVIDEQLGTITTQYDSDNWVEYFFNNINDPIFDCSIRLINSKSRKYTRARKKIESIILNYNEPVFITLTFMNDVLKSTSCQTRRRYVARYLKEYCAEYVANIDFSPKKNREHYHAVISSRIDINQWPYGFVWVESINKSVNAAKLLSHYINKLTAHAFKVDATRLIYSRDLV